MVALARSIFVWASRRRVKKTDAKLNVLGRRMGLLQIGAAAELFSTMPALATIADGGVGARKSLRAIEAAIESGSHLAPERMQRTFDELDRFITDANMVLDEYDRGRPEHDRLFVPRREVRGLF